MQMHQPAKFSLPIVLTARERITLKKWHHVEFDWWFLFVMSNEYFLQAVLFWVSTLQCSSVHANTSTCQVWPSNCTHSKRTNHIKVRHHADFVLWWHDNIQWAFLGQNHDSMSFPRPKVGPPACSWCICYQVCSSKSIHSKRTRRLNLFEASASW
jgi:hypothetical protein